MLLLHLVDVVDLLDGFFYCHTQVVQVDRFGGEVESPVVHGLADVAHIAAGTNHDDFQRGIAHLVHFGQQRQAVHLWHVDVRQDNLHVGVLQHQRKSFQSVVCKYKLIFALSYFTPEILCQQ